MTRSNRTALRLSSTVATLGVLLLAAAPQVASAQAAKPERADSAPDSHTMAARPSCIVIAKRRAGKGDPIPETRVSTFGSKPCERAKKDCERKLEQLKKRQRELDAACVVTQARGV